MKFKALLMASMAAATTVFAGGLSTGEDALILTFKTQGPDRYADGQIVKDGEFYALVWIAKPAVGVAIDVDGKAVGLDQAGNKVESQTRVLCTTKSKDGAFERVYQIANPSDYVDGTFSLVLLDTRDAQGNPSASSSFSEDGRVNGYVVVGECSTPVVSGLAGVQGTKTATDPQIAAIASLIPENIENPRITGIDVRNGKVFLTVTGTSAKLDYGVAAASTPEGLVNAQPDKGAKAGNGEITLEVEIPAGQQGQFFKVGRKPLK